MLVYPSIIKIVIFFFKNKYLTYLPVFSKNKLS
ncbi:hypothetical protein CoNPh3_CDS0162 [Staphylococcus phage S-CoN_Ph3]|nr:hypothetical protein CoNPh3_CDS0162 [Staphylococcus phage S-CoN_Ph3]